MRAKLNDDVRELEKPLWMALTEFPDREEHWCPQ